MSTMTETAPKPTATTTEVTNAASNSSSDPDPGCCTVPPDTDPGPIKG